MKIVSIDRELNTDQIYIYIIIALKIYNKNYKKRGIFCRKKKNYQKNNTKNVFMNFEIPLSTTSFPKALVLLFTDILH